MDIPTGDDARQHKEGGVGAQHEADPDDVDALVFNLQWIEGCQLGGTYN